MNKLDKIRANALRWLVLVVVIIALNIGVSRLLAAFSGPLSTSGGMLVSLTMLSILLLYALLLAIPFMPGVEIGISVLVAHGSQAAPYVYLATMAGLSLSYGLGVAFSERFPSRFLAAMGLGRACALVDTMKDLNKEERLLMLEESLPGWVGRWVVKRRYLMLAVALNLPGNSLIGGGGGIVMLAGLSRLFSPFLLLITLALATAPVPIAVYIFGADLIR